MNINQVSFGKAVKINASKEVAQQLLDAKKNKENEGTILNGFLNTVFGAEKIEDEFIYEVGKKETYVFTNNDAIASGAFISYGAKGSDTLNSDKMAKIAFNSTALQDKGVLTITKKEEEKTKDEKIQVVLKDACYTDAKGHKLNFNAIG